MEGGDKRGDDGMDRKNEEDLEEKKENKEWKDILVVISRSSTPNKFLRANLPLSLSSYKQYLRTVGRKVVSEVGRVSEVKSNKVK